jgi:hypothetical protein
MHPVGTGASGDPLDTDTPSNFRQLDGLDQDLGSTLPAIVPAPAGSTVTNLGVQGNKEQKLCLLDLANLSGQGGPSHIGGELQKIDVPRAAKC